MNDQDLAEIGRTVLNLAAASILMRHVSPAGTADYAEPEGFAQQIAWDFTRWTARGTRCEEGDRLMALLREAGWLNEMVAQLPAVAS